MKYTDLQIKQKIDELWGGGGVPDYTTMPAYKLKKASKNGKKFFVPSNEPTPKGVEAIEGVLTKSQYAPVAPGGQTSAIPGGQSSPRKAVPNVGNIVTLDKHEYKVINVSQDRKSFDVVNVNDPREVHKGILVDSNPFFIEGKSPHKKGTKKYKKHMAAMHAESGMKEEMSNRFALYVDGKDSQVRMSDEDKAQELADQMNKDNKKVEVKKVGVNEEEFGGRFITQDFNDILRDPVLKLPQNIKFDNFLKFLEFAMTDSQYKGMSLEKFGDKLKMIFSQWKANLVHGVDKRNKKGSIPDPIKPTAYRTPEGKVPLDADKWFMIESEAKEKLNTYPSKYQTTWALKKYKDAGGKWSK